MPYLLDTDVCIAAMKGAAIVVEKMSALTPNDCVVSTVTGYELFTGVEKCSQPARELAKVRLLLANVSQLPFDAGAAREAARIRADLESKGLPIGPYDILIAGHALSAGLTLVTSNTSEFSRVAGLAIENWQDTNSN